MNYLLWSIIRQMNLLTTEINSISYLSPVPSCKQIGPVVFEEVGI